MNNYVPSDFNMSIWDVIIEAGAIQFWIAIAIGMLFIGLLVMILESKNTKIEKFKKYVSESIEDIFGEDK
jgi:hypothetical protein